MRLSRIPLHVRRCPVELWEACTALCSSQLKLHRLAALTRGCLPLSTSHRMLSAARGGRSLTWLVVLAIALIALTTLVDVRLPLSTSADLSQLPALQSAVQPASFPFHPFYDLQQSRVAVFEALIDVYLRPWTPLPGNRPTITSRMLDTMETIYRGAAFRIRIVGNKLLYRHTVWWGQTYRLDRMNWWLRFLQELIDSGRITGSLDAVLSMSDGPRVGSDSNSQGKEGSAGFPLFTMRTSVLHIDIPLVDSVVFGSNGRYVWDEEAKQVPWTEKAPRAVFRGSASCFTMHVDNWHICPRVIAVQLAKQHPEQLDIGVTRWNQVGKLSVLYPPCSDEEVEQSTNITLVEPMSFLEQARYKYIIDMDGGVGSSRKPVSTHSLTHSLFPFAQYHQPTRF